MPDATALKVIQKGAERIVEVTDDEIAEAIRAIYSATHNCAEGGCRGALGANQRARTAARAAGGSYPNRAKHRSGMDADCAGGRNAQSFLARIVLVGKDQFGVCRSSRVNGPFNLILYEISIWAIPALIAITFHEASHGYVAHVLGDDTAWRLGRVSFNPLVHIDPFGTVVLPVMLLLLHAPFLFGYAKPVPVNFRALRYPRVGTILVAAAGPGMNLLLATIAALAFHIVGYVPAPGAQWLAANLKNALLLNVILAIFNLLPIPPPRWRTHLGRSASRHLGSLAFPFRALRLADTHRSAFPAASAWCTARH